MRNKYLKSSAFLLAPAIVGSALPGSVSNASFLGKAWEYVVNSFWSLWAKMKFWEIKEQYLANGEEIYKDFSDANGQNNQLKWNIDHIDKAKVDVLKNFVNSGQANDSGKPQPDISCNRILHLQEIDTTNHKISYDVVDYNTGIRLDLKYRYSLFVSNSENCIQLEDFSNDMRGDSILFNPNKPYELKVFCTNGGDIMTFDFRNKAQVKKHVFNYEGKEVSTLDLGNVPSIVEEVETIISWIKEYDEAFYSQFETKANNMGGFLGDNMQGVQNNNNNNI